MREAHRRRGVSSFQDYISLLEQVADALWERVHTPQLYATESEHRRLSPILRFRLHVADDRHLMVAIAIGAIDMKIAHAVGAHNQRRKNLHFR